MNRNCLKLRLYPTKAQARQLDQTLETCRLVYNSLVNDRKFQYETAGVLVGRYDQQAYLPVWKESHCELGKVYSQVLQDVVHRVSLAFDAFFDRVKKGETPGFPRIKGDGYDSITYTQKASFKGGQQSIHLAKIGQVKAKRHRRPWGELKNCTVRRIVIAVEKLNVKNMLGNHCLAKSISDAAWSQFRHVLVQKAESAVNREVVQCNAASTSQDCSGCGYRPDGLEGRTKKKLSDRWHLCPVCGASLDRDTNAAVNILTLGQQSVASVKA